MFASVFVANSIIPATVVLAAGSSPVFVPEFVPVIWLVKATVPVALGNVTTWSPFKTAVVSFNSLSASVPEAPSNSNVLFETIFTVSLAVVVSPETIRFLTFNVSELGI